MNQIYFKTIPHNQMRYETCGDYWIDPAKVWQFRVSEMANPDYEFLVLIHELVEWYLTQKRGIHTDAIDYFDVSFEKLRELNPELIGDMEPGHMSSAPYHKEHVFAEKIERLIAEELGVTWSRYDKAVGDL